MLLGFKERFAPFVLDGSKTHTIRAMRKRPFKVGDMCDCYVNPRQKTMRLLGRWPCVKVQAIRICAFPDPGCPLDVEIDSNSLVTDEIQDFFRRDGFRSRNPAQEALAFWKGRLPFYGQIIHWRYS